MGNCISKIKKDHFFAIEALMKNEILFSNGIIRFGLDMLTGGTYMRLHSIKKIPEKNNICYITNWGIVERPLKRVDTKRYSMLS